MARRTNDKNAVLSKDLPTKAKGFSSCRTGRLHLRPGRVFGNATFLILTIPGRKTIENLIFQKNI
jgi:hypothetical protein